MRRASFPALLLAASLLGCLPAPTGTVPGNKPSVKPTGVSPRPSASSSLAPTGSSPSPAASTSVPVVPRTLEGVVRLPALLAAQVPVISNNGGGIISDNGAGIISNNGSGYRLFATPVSQPLANVQVRLVDAAGQAVLGSDGKALTALTDAQGRYGFQTALPERNLLVEVQLKDGAGAARAIAPPSTTARTVDVDLVSTLSTNYILARYVKTQPDPLATLEKLPATVEAETRTKTGAALAGGQTAVPETLTDEKVLATVEVLRKQDTALDAQMETVKKLLIAAGQSDLGNGQAAVDVLMRTIRQILPAPDGSVYLDDGVIWKVTPDQKLVRVTGAGAAETGLAGKKAVDAKLGTIRHMAIDAQNRLWLLQAAPAEKLWRIEADGTLKDMTGGVAMMTQFVPTTGDGFMALAQDRWGDPVELWEVSATGAAQKLKTFTGVEGTVLASSQTITRDASGHLLFSGLISPSIIPEAYRLDPAAGTLSVIKSVKNGAATRVGMDAKGNVYYALGGVVKAIAPSGTETTVTGIDSFHFVHGLAAAADGGHFWLGGPDNASVYRLKNGVKTLYAGKEGQGGALGGSANATALKDPRGLAVADDGTLYVLDDGLILRFKPDQAAETVLAKDALKDGETVLTPINVQRDGQGKIYVVGGVSSFGIEGRHLFRLESTGAWTKLYSSTNGLENYIVGADGAITIAEIRHVDVSTHLTRVLRRSPAGQVETLVPESEGFLNQMAFAFDAQGRLLIHGSHKGEPSIFGRIWRHQAGSAPELLPATAFWPEARDAQGREYAGRRFVDMVEDNTLRRHFPATGEVEVLAGKTGRFFSGDGVDDGVNWPLYPAFDAKGNLYFLDQKNKQVKRLPAEVL